MNNILITVIGPTAIGKTSLAIKLAKHYNTEIISADSMLVYKNFNIGSAKPPKAVLDKVKHHLINIVSPLEDFDAWRYMKMGREIIYNSKVSNHIVVGGTQLYIKSLIEGLSLNMSKNAEIRKSITDDFNSHGIEFIYSKLKAIDSKGASSISPNDKQRIIRYLEINYSTGMRVSEVFSLNDNQRIENVNYIKVALSIEKEQLNDRIDLRVDNMIKDGLVDEVISLRREYPLNIKPFRSIGYMEINRYLNSEISLDQAVELIKIRTKQFAKRQRTWLRKDSEINWFHNLEDLITFCTQYATN